MSLPKTTFGVAEGDIVARSFIPGYIVLSYIVSYIGSVTTLELIHRRTSGRGVHNAFFLGGASVTMGAIAIWCMHFIGNRAIVMGDGQLELQIGYSSTFTGLSFFVPIIVLLAAFLTVGTNEQVGKIRVCVGGTLAGLAICGMHYIGQAGIANYTSVYKIANVVGAALIAVVASVTALTIFFVLRAAWTNSWWKRSLCAILLAGGVSGMHWIASVGTQYRYKRLNTASQLSRNQTVIVVIVLSIGACATLLMLAIVAQKRRLQSASQAKQVVLACATFDPDGRLLVTPEGLLPSEKITNTYIERSFDDLFSIAHPAFLWVFRTTRNWVGIQDLVPGMRHHLQTAATLSKSPPGSRGFAEAYLTADGVDASDDYSVIFRELFCVAAAELATQIHEPLCNLGVLYDEIMNTGTLTRSRRKLKWVLNEKSCTQDVESGLSVPATLGRGQLLFVVRRASKAEAVRLQGRGYRFASVSNVVDNLARSMQVEKSDLAARMACMREYSKGDQIMEPGVHLGCFAIRARVGGGGFDVLVRRMAKNRLPAVQLPIAELEGWHLDFLQQSDGWSVGAFLDWLSGQTAFYSAREKVFASQLRRALEHLSADIDDPLFLDAMLVAKPMLVPCRGLGEQAVPGRASLIAFRIIFPINSRKTKSSLQFSPLDVFRCQQHVYRNAPDHALFARKIHREFASLVDLRPKTKASHASNRRSAQMIPHLTPSRNSPQPKQWWGPLAALERRPSGHVPTLKNNAEDRKSVASSLGGIMVSQEVSIDIREMRDGDDHTRVELRTMGLGTIGNATAELEDSETFVDRLFAVCIEGR